MKSTTTTMWILAILGSLLAKTHADCPNTKSDTTDSGAKCKDCATGQSRNGSCSYETYSVADATCNCGSGTECVPLPSIAVNATRHSYSGGSCYLGVCFGYNLDEIDFPTVYPKGTVTCPEG